MSKLDLDSYTEQTIDGADNTPIPPVQEQVKEKEAEETTDSKEKTVLLEGPLSQVYAKALIEVMGNSIQYVGEANSVEATAIMMMSKDESIPDDAVIYAVDQTTIDRDAAAVYDGLRVALDKREGKKYVVLESKQVISKSMSLITDFAREKADRVFYSRESFLKFIKC